MISDIEKMNLFIAGDWDPIEKIIREEIAKELELNYIGATYTTWEDGFDYGMKKAIEIVRKATNDK
jgi:hypothetical protein